MKIKAVCESTGLTDRTIRYYIEEGLISPAYTENYLGRKTFDFSDTDVDALKDVAVLRKFGFSIAEIKEMILCPDCIIRISKELQRRKQASVDEERSLLTALSKLDTSRKYTVSELAAFLSQPVCEASVPKEDSKPNYFKRTLLFIKRAIIFLITWSPVAHVASAFFYSYRKYQYLVIDGRTLLIVLILCLPTIFILLLAKLKLKPLPKRIVKAIVLIFCLWITPLLHFLALCTFSSSETSNHHNYRKFDSCCMINRDSIAQDLFPPWPTYSSDIEYYYFLSESVFGAACDVYAQWSLDADAFASEVSHMQNLYETTAETDITHSTLQVEGYTCFVLYTGSPPFEPATGDYIYYIFAYNAKSRTVRYIYSYSEVGGQPYYLSLEW